MFFLCLLIVLALLAGGWWWRRPRGPRIDDIDRLDEATRRDLGLTQRELARWPSPSCERLFH